MKDKYKNIMKKQYKDLMYTVKSEAIDGKTAVVEVELEVYDYAKEITKVENELLNNSEKFKDSTGEVNTNTYNDYKLSNLEKVTERVKYTISGTKIRNMKSKKEKEKWIM